MHEPADARRPGRNYLANHFEANNWKSDIYFKFSTQMMIQFCSDCCSAPIIPSWYGYCANHFKLVRTQLVRLVKLQNGLQDSTGTGRGDSCDGEDRDLTDYYLEHHGCISLRTVSVEEGLLSMIRMPKSVSTKALIWTVGFGVIFVFFFQMMNICFYIQ